MRVDGSADILLDIAYKAIEAHLSGDGFLPPALPDPWHEARPVFVTLRTADGNLRGCIGHLVATRSSLADEVASDAVAAATRDNRFRPVRADELPTLSISVSILEAPEPVDDVTGQDPKEWGLVVHSGQRRGVLLPDLDGIDTVEEQIRICRQKGGISTDAPVQYERFRVTKVGAA